MENKTCNGLDMDVHCRDYMLRETREDLRGDDEGLVLFTHSRGWIRNFWMKSSQTNHDVWPYYDIEENL